MKKFLITSGTIAVGIILAVLALKALEVSWPFTIKNNYDKNSATINYADFIAILLTAVTVILSALGFVIAMLAFVGWNSIKGKVEEQAEDLISKSLSDKGELQGLVKKSLQPGGSLHRLVQDEAQGIIYAGIQPVSLTEEEEDITRQNYGT